MQLQLNAVLRRFLRFASDVFVSAVAFFIVAILPLIQVSQSTALWGPNGLFVHLLLYTAIAAAALRFTRSYRMIWRFVSFWDLLTLMGEVTLCIAGFVLAEIVLFDPIGSAPGTLVAWTLVVLWTVNVGLLAVPRFTSRLCAETIGNGRNRRLQHNPDCQTVLLTGDPSRVESFIRECNHDPAARYNIAGVLTDDQQFHGSLMHGVAVLGSVANLKSILGDLSEGGIKPTTLVLAEETPGKRDLPALLEASAASNLKLGRLPPMGLVKDRTAVLPLDLGDLLHRPEIQLDTGRIAKLVEGKCVLITGGGGSIGSELSRQVASFGPSNLVVLDACEFNLYAIDKELEEKFPAVHREAALVDVRDEQLVKRWFAKVRPDVVFHAAALKHVPLLEDHPIEAIKTNVLGTINLAEACAAAGVSAMVTISTDKAVNPTNVMGATKRLAEAYCQGLDQAQGDDAPTRFVTVRFGNVLGSAGSVVPLFKRQIESGGPVTVTHPEITRFFMTIPEAVSLVLQAGAQGLNLAEERGNIYLLDMGKPVKIIDLARQMICLTGARPDVDIPIKIVGLRPGEKLYEETIHTEEAVLPTRNKSILKLEPRATDLRIIRQQILELRHACTTWDREKVIRLLKISVPGYVPDTRERAAAP